MPEVVRDDLVRTRPFTARADTDDDSENDGLTLDGYGAVFPASQGDRTDPAVTLIDSWEGTFFEELARGCFKKSLKERTPRMQFDHGRHPLIGSIPIGTFSDGYPREDDKGLHCIGRLADNWLIQPVRDAIASKAVDGMSFRFAVIQETWTDVNGKRITDPRQVAELIWSPSDEGPMLRTIKEVKLSEVGPVVWPAYEATSVGVRSGATIIDLGRLHEPATRNLLARAVLMVDAAENEQERKSRTPVGPQSNVTPVDHSNTEPRDSDPSSGEHLSPEKSARIRADLSAWLTTSRTTLQLAVRSEQEWQE